MQCAICGNKGGRFRLHKGKEYCHRCLTTMSVKNRPRVPYVPKDFKPWFSWSIGEQVSSRDHERTLERKYACAGPNDKDYQTNVLGIDEGTMEHATETTLNRDPEVLNADRKLGKVVGEAVAAAASEGKRVFAGGKVQPTPDSQSGAM